jgi:hypothetical protein
VIAAFLKRLARLTMGDGICHSVSDKMFVISFIANMIKRHPRCVRLIHRKKKIIKEQLTFASDPYRHQEPDPSKARALKSSLWELDALMNCELDETVRNYSKLFKGDISRKTGFFKCEQFTGQNSLDMILKDLEGINVERENVAITKSILIANRQWKDPKEMLGKRKAESGELLDLNPSNYTKMRLAERYTTEQEFFELQ